MTATLDISALRHELEAVAVPANVEQMSAYMRHQFLFLGVKTPSLRATAKPTLLAAGAVPTSELIEFVNECWRQPEREFQHVGTIMLRKYASRLEPANIDNLAHFITTKSWWDTIDALAAWSVGPLVKAHPELLATMDQWIDSDNFWLARTAILHQLSFKDETDAERLFRYASTRAADTEFFIRKAIGWALRQYARQAPDAVKAYVLANESELSGLTKREALKHIKD